MRDGVVGVGGGRPLIAIISLCTVIWLSEAAGCLGWNNMRMEGEGSAGFQKTLRECWREGLGGVCVCVCLCVCICVVWNQVTQSVINKRTAVMRPR